MTVGNQDQIWLDVVKQDRLSRTRSLMDDLGLDILVTGSTDSIQGQGNVRFLTNYATAFSTSLAVLGRGAEPSLLVPAGSFQSGWARKMAWCRDVQPVQDLAEGLVDLLRQSGKDGDRVGLVGFDAFPGSIQTQVAGALPRVRFVTADAPFRLMRAVKSPMEIEMARQSVALADSAFEDVLSAIEVGIPEKELFSRAESRLTLGGAEDKFLLISSDVNSEVMPMPAERLIGEKDYLRFSIELASVGGFWTQTIRVFSSGEPSPDLRKVFDPCLDALHLAEERLKPGVVGGDLARDLRQVLEASGGQVGPLGHGMGLDLTEPPYMLPHDQTLIKPGMVIAIHPNLTLNQTNVWIGDTFLVTEDGAERLSHISCDLRSF